MSCSLQLGAVQAQLRSQQATLLRRACSDRITACLSGTRAAQTGRDPGALSDTQALQASRQPDYSPGASKALPVFLNNPSLYPSIWNTYPLLSVSKSISERQHGPRQVGGAFTAVSDV